MDTNKVWLTGQAISDPIMTTIAKKTPSATFLIQVNESYIDWRGTPQTKPNVFTVESLGNHARATMEKVKKGLRYSIEGYLRSESRKDVDKYIIRTFAITLDESHDSAMYYQGMEQALEIVRTSRDRNSSIEKLSEKLQEVKTNEGRKRF